MNGQVRKLELLTIITGFVFACAMTPEHMARYLNAHPAER